MRCVILAAVSTPDQVHDASGGELESIPSQIRRSREVIARRGWTEVVEPLIVPGQTRSINWLHEAIAAIPAYRELVALVDAGAVDLVVCRHYNRLARTAALQQQISAYLKERRVQIYALELPVEPQNPETWQPRSDSSRVWMEAIAGAVSESDINQLWNYHRSGMEGRTRRGIHPEGIPNFGYRDVVAADGYGHSHRKRVPDDVEFPILKRILRMLLEGRTGVYCAQWLNGQVDNAEGRAPIPARKGGMWTSAHIISIVRNPFIAGKVARYRYTYTHIGKRKRRKPNELPGMLVDGVHEPAIGWDDWQRIQVLLTDRARDVPRLRRRDYIWSGLAVCGYCLDRDGKPRPMRYCSDTQSNKTDDRIRTYSYLICSAYSRSAGILCQRNTISVENFSAAVFDVVRAAIADPDVLASPSHDAETTRPIADRERLIAASSRLDDERRRWDEAYAGGALDLVEYAERIRDVRRRRDLLDRELADLDRRISSRTEHDHRRQQRAIALAALADRELRVDDPEVVMLIHQILGRAEVRGGQVVIVGR